MRLFLALFFAAVAALAPGAAPAQTTSEVQSLREVDRIAVVVEELHEALLQAGVTQDALRELAERHFAGAGIRVVPLDTLLGAPVPAYLYLRPVVHADAATGLYAVALTAELRQPGSLRGHERETLVTTWTEVVAGLSDRASLAAITRETVLQAGRSFVRDYGAARTSGGAAEGSP